MYKTIFATFILFFSAITISPQNINTNCPELFTRSKVKNPSINIIKIEVLDSIKYTTQPTFIIDKDSLEKLMMYPEIAKRAGVEGIVVIRVQIDENGKATKIILEKGIGAGCDDAALYAFQKTSYKNAKILDKNISSEILVTINFSLNISIDEPNLIIDEIVYVDHSPIYFYKKFVFNKNGLVTYYEHDKTSESDLAKNKMGKINIDTYIRLSDFIISQCFLEYKNYYHNSFSDHERREIVTVKINSDEKYVSSNGKGDPIGLWALINLIKLFQNQIEWEEVKE